VETTGAAGRIREEDIVLFEVIRIPTAGEKARRYSKRD
jgi:hypothetical protein